MATLLQLRTQARQRADMVKSKFVTDEELTSYVNASMYELYDLLVSTYEDWYIADPITFTLTGTADAYSLPTDFYKLRGIDRSVDGTENGTWFTVTPFMFIDRNKYNQINNIGGTIPTVKYRLMGDNLKFVPYNVAAGLYRMWYIPSAPLLVDDTDTFNGVDGWEEYIVVDCAIKMLAKQEDDVSVFMAQKNALKQRIEELAAERDAGSSATISDGRAAAQQGYFSVFGNGTLL